MVTQFFAPVTGGEERLVEDLRDELGARGHHVSVATTTDGGERVFEGGARVRRVGSLLGRIPLLHADDMRRHAPPFPDPESALSLRRIIAEERPDVIHCHNWLVHSILPVVARSGIPLVLTLHDYGLVCANKRMTRHESVCPGPALERCLTCATSHYGIAKGVPTALLLRASSGAVRRSVDMFLPISDAVAEASGLRERGLPHEVIPNFVPDALLDAPPPASARAEGVPDGPYLVFAGDVTADKGVAPLLDAHGRIPDAPPLVLVGRVMPGDIGLDRPGVHVLGPRPHAELMEIFRGSLGVVVPSIWSEPFGLVALEAMSVGRPVIASRVGGLATVVGHEETGLLVRPGDVPGLEAALRRLCGSPELCDRWGEAGARRARMFAASAIVPRVEAVYRALIAGSRGADDARRSTLRAPGAGR